MDIIVLINLTILVIAIINAIIAYINREFTEENFAKLYQKDSAHLFAGREKALV